MVQASFLTGIASDRSAEIPAVSEGLGQPPPGLRLLALVAKPMGLAPGQRFRLEQWAPWLSSRHGIEIDFLPFESPRLTDLLYLPGRRIEKGFWMTYDFLRRAKVVLRARQYDAVLVSREAALIGPAFYERLLARQKTPTIFDFDDAIWLPTQVSPVNGIFSRLHFWGKAATNCRIADAVTAGNRYLAQYAQAKNDNVFVIPTSIELDDYRVQPEPAEPDPFIVCWSGSRSTLAHFEYARHALERLAARRKIVVKVICNTPATRPIEGAENVFVPWSVEGETETLGASHVGIMPLPDDEYARGKCGLKALQYMAVGRPAVISPVGMNEDLIDSGINGFLARTDDEWLDALNHLADSPELRARIGAAGRKTVEDDYSAEVVARKFATAVRRVIANRT